MSEKKWKWLFGCLGFSMLVIVIWMGSYVKGMQLGSSVPVKGCQADVKSATGFSRVIVAMEFTTSDCQTRQILQGKEGQIVGGKRQTSKAMESLRMSTYVDFLFLLVYSVFLGAFAIFLSEWGGRKILVFGLLFASMGLVGDTIENLQLLALFDAFLRRPEVVGGRYVWLQVFTWIKWCGLASAFGLLAVPLWGQGGGWKRFASLCCGCVAFVGWAGFVMDRLVSSHGMRVFANRWLELNLFVVVLGFLVLLLDGLFFVRKSVS